MPFSEATDSDILTRELERRATLTVTWYACVGLPDLEVPGRAPFAEYAERGSGVRTRFAEYGVREPGIRTWVAEYGVGEPGVRIWVICGVLSPEPACDIEMYLRYPTRCT